VLKNIDPKNVIHQGTYTTTILEANESAEKKSCLKILNDEFPAALQLKRFENEFEFSHNASSNVVRKAREKKLIDNHQAIVFDYVDGINLKSFLSLRQRSSAELVQVAMNIANAISEIHRENIIHKNLNPLNILVENHSERIFLIDFELASLLRVNAEQHIMGGEELNYISPEQTGRINRSTDHRTDLYAFGILLYEMFTGVLPFESNDPMEIIHGHLAKALIAPKEINKSIPGILSKVILKLLEKNAEQRYQSAFGVKYDLKKCLDQLTATGKIDPFEIATNDFSGKFFLQQKLYGRESELNTLFSVFEKSLSGYSRLLMVSGYTGSGKTSLVTELQKTVSAKKGYLISGRFGEFQNETPYAPFIQAFTEFIGFILTGDEAQLLKWKNRITDSAGKLGKILTDFIPTLETLIGVQPEVAELKGLEAQNRFNYVMLNFIKALTDESHPIVLFIDDLQRADASSFMLFNLISKDKEIDHLLLIGAYRSNEVNDSHPLSEMLDGLREENEEFDELEVKALAKENILQMIQDFFRTGQRDAVELAEIIFKKTNGNTFYVQRFLQSIYEEEFLYFDFEQQQWKWTRDKILQMNVSGNVVELMTSSLRKLSKETLDLLEIAACCGARFDVLTLAAIKQYSQKKIEKILRQALLEGLIIPFVSSYKFAHDSIQNAIYSLIGENERKAMHLLIGEAYSKIFSDKEKEERLFDLVNQWNNGSDLITKSNNKHYLSELNLAAGRKARAAGAYKQALNYFEKGISLLETDCWITSYAHALRLYNQATEAAFLCAEHDRVSDFAKEVILNKKEFLDSIYVDEILIQKFIAQNKQREAIGVGLADLKTMGIDLPTKPGKITILYNFIKTNILLKRKSSEPIVSWPEMTDASKQAAMRLMAEIAPAAYFEMPELIVMDIFKMLEFSANSGLSKKSPLAFSTFGYILCAFFGKVDTGIKYGKIALELVDKLKAEELRANINLVYYVFLIHWKISLGETIKGLEDAYRSGLETGDYEFSSYLAHAITYHSFYSGLPLRKLEEKSELLGGQIEKYKQELTLIRLRLFRQSILNLIDESNEPEKLNGDLFDESQYDIKYLPQNAIYFQNLYLQKMVVALIFNKYEQAYQYSLSCSSFHKSVAGSALQPLLYFYQSLAITSIAHTKTGKERSILLHKLAKNTAQIKKYEKLCAKNISHKRLLIEAESCRIKGKPEEARNLYDEAIKEARENGMVQDEALCWEMAGNFYNERKQELVGKFYMHNAMKAYKRWGADAKEKQMSVRYGAKIITDTSHGKDMVHTDLDLAAVIKASTALSGEIALPKLLKKLIQILLENAGAQRGYFILEKGGGRFIEAEGSSDKEDIVTMQSVPVANCGLLAESIMNYVATSRESVILDNAAESLLFSNDEYIKANRSKSILCAPFMNKGKIQGIIYLSNDLITGAFTGQRLALLRLLTGQIAISIENALFYDDLENQILHRTRDLQIEKKKSDDLLLNILPEEIANELKETGSSEARQFDNVTVLFTDFVNFTGISEKLSPKELVAELDLCFKAFDEIIERNDLVKIKTIGDAYLAVCGLPNEDRQHAEKVVKAGLEISRFMRMRSKTISIGNGLREIRVGIHSGSVVAGIIGVKRFAYDIWGDTVNTAARMEENGESGKINISSVTYELVKNNFHCEPRGKISAKNKGEIDMYFVEGEKSAETVLIV
jgi:histidine kinase